MKRKLRLLVLVGAILLSVSPVLADGDFYVVAVGGGVGTKITSLPYTQHCPVRFLQGGARNAPVKKVSEEAIIFLTNSL